MGMIRKAENQPFMVGQKQFTPSAYHIAKRKNVYLSFSNIFRSLSSTRLSIAASVKFFCMSVR